MVGTRQSHLYVWSSSGGVLEGWEVCPRIDYDICYTPIIADLDGDGDVEVIVAANDYFQGQGGKGGIYIYDLDAPYDESKMEWPMWNHDTHNTSWYGFENIRPQAITDLSLTQSEEGVILHWSPVATDIQGNPEQIRHYKVYRSTDPSFVPDNSDLIGTTTDTTFIDSTGVSGKQFYIVRSLDKYCNLSGISNRMEVIGRETGEVLSSRAVQPGDTVRVKVRDGDQNTNPGEIDSVSVTVRNLRSGESEGVTLMEAGADSAIFRGGLSTAYGVDVNPGGGMLNVVGGDTVVVEYLDGMSRMGENVLVADTTLVVSLFGDVTGNGSVGAYDASLILQERVGHIVLPDPNWPNLMVEVGDVTGDGTLSALDASYILQYVVRKIRVFPVQTQEIPKPVFGQRLVWLEGAGRGIVHVTIDEMDGVVAGEMMLSFAGVLSDVTVRASELTSSYLVASKVENSCIRVSFAGAESGSGPGPVLEMVFDAPDTGLLSSLRLERASLNEGRIPVQIVEEVEIPKAYRLSQNYPNPFNPETTIHYDLAKTGAVRLSIYALTGQLIRILVDKESSAGRYSVTWDGTDDTGRGVASGLYLCRMEAGEFSTVRKLVLVR